MIDKSSPIPIYYQLKQDFLANISSGKWQRGHCIDSERELSEYYGVSRMTIRQALGELVQEGILYKEKGKGTFVSEEKLKQKDIMSFSEIISKAGLTLETKVLEFTSVNTPDNLKGIFSCEQLYKIDRLRIVDGEPVAKELVYVPVTYLADVKHQELKGSLFLLLEKRGHTIAFSEASIQAVMIDDDLKELFKVEKEVPLLKTVNVVMEKESQVLFYEESIYRSDKYILQVNIMRKEGRMR